MLHDPLDISDISFTRPNFRRNIRPVPISGLSNPLDVRDINRGDRQMLNPRRTNPLDPVYTVSTKNGMAVPGTVGGDSSPATIGDIADSKPRKLIRNLSVPACAPIDKSTPQRYVGCLPHSSVGAGGILRPGGMPTGSRVGSLKRGLVTKRAVDPLDPNYRLLDGQFDSASKILMRNSV